MWLTKLKIAVVQKDIQTLEKLLDDLPTLDNEKDIQSALYLLREASELVHTLKDDTASSMKRMKKTMDFLKSTELKAPHKFDIKS